MASKIAFIACVTLLAFTSQVRAQTLDQNSASQIASNIATFLQGLIGSANGTVLNNVRDTSTDFNFEFRNISFRAVDPVIFDMYSLDTTLNVLELTFHTSLMVNIPYYRGNGTLMTLPLNSQATGSIAVDEIHFNIVAPFTITQINNQEEELSLGTHSYGFSILDGVTYNLVFSDQKFNDPSVVQFLNDNWIGITTESSMPVYDALVARWMSDLQTWLSNTSLLILTDNSNTVETTTVRS